jgi:phosphosulfolactate synthase
MIVDNQLRFLKLPARPRPRKEGLTVLFDMWLSMKEVESVLEVASETLDYAKFVHAGMAFGDVLPDGWMQDKISLYKAKGIKTYPGGVPYQIALVQDKVREYMQWVSDVGFDGVEIAEDAMSYEASTEKTRDQNIKMALDLGLFVDTELGKKSPDKPLDLSEAYDMIMRDLGLGVSHVVIERAELNEYIGKDPKPLVDLVGRVGLKNIVLEPGPFGWPDVHDWCFKQFGPKANLSNIYVDELMYVEFSRRGLSRFGYWYFDEFKSKAVK